LVDELMLVFQNTNFETQFNWYACFAFANPFSMWLKNREYFFFVGNHFSLDDTTFNLADLTLGMLEVSSISILGSRSVDVVVVSLAKVEWISNYAHWFFTRTKFVF
jgi:hypothetical protein